MPITIKPYIDMQFDKTKMYFVSILYDKHISWEFCVRMLKEVFYKNQKDAETIAHAIVTDGEGFCGMYLLEIAETKAEIIEAQAKKEGFSLFCLVEEV